MSPLVRISLVLGFYTIFFSLLALAYGNEVGYASLILGLVTVAGSIFYAVRERRTVKEGILEEDGAESNS
jgi:1,4-dihydroxy-2-naphthoate octaprenyltransferase